MSRANHITKKIAGTAAGLSVLFLFGAVGSIETKTDTTGHAFLWASVELIVFALSVYGWNRFGGDQE